VEYFGLADRRAILFVRGDTPYIMIFTNQKGGMYYMGDARAFTGGKYIGLMQNYVSLVGTSDTMSKLFTMIVT
jgi:hypothetical protein